MQKLKEKKRFCILQMKTHKVELVKNVKKKNVFDFTDDNSYNHEEYWKFETSGDLFQINAMNVRNRQFEEGILANTNVRFTNVRTFVEVTEKKL